MSSRKLSAKAQAIFDAIPEHGAITPLDLERASGLGTGDYYSHVAGLTRGKHVERNQFGNYMRAKR